MNRAASIGIFAAVSLCAVAVWSASAQERSSRETGATLWRQACGGCHGEASFNGQTLKTIRTLGAPRIRHALVDNDESAHPILQRFSEAQIDLLLDYLKPENAAAQDCEASPRPGAAQDCPEQPAAADSR